MSTTSTTADPLVRLGRWITTLTERSPITNTYALTRSLLAAGSLITLLANPTGILFMPQSNAPMPPRCGGVSDISVYCVAPSIGWGKWISVLVLLAVLSGYFPRLTAIPHWWVSFSFQASASVLDGGDQVTAVLSAILIPIALCDGRRNHWSDNRDTTTDPGERARAARLIAWVAVGVVRIQASMLYLQAGIAKLGVPEWANGTAMYYWMNDPMFGAPPWATWILQPLLHNGLTVALFTWSVVFVEVVFAAGLVAPKKWWRPILLVAVVFHAGIALTMGLVSFACAMIALDVLFLHPADKNVSTALPRRLVSRLRRATAR
ncbi:sporulation-delaying protein SdpB family protein [Actinosynnema sp. NPDC020468]|uniref:sporulation-delaying protein SdpB family protein n=1 Tax=Actinosynnema sp. NPDC020468 TaxID=3154488 RepID=UPI0033C59DB5